MFSCPGMWCWWWWWYGWWLFSLQRGHLSSCRVIVAFSALLCTNRRLKTASSQKKEGGLSTALVSIAQVLHWAKNCILGCLHVHLKIVCSRYWIFKLCRSPVQGNTEHNAVKLGKTNLRTVQLVVVVVRSPLQVTCQPPDKHQRHLLLSCLADSA